MIGPALFELMIRIAPFLILVKLTKMLFFPSRKIF